MDPLFPSHDGFAASSHTAFLHHHQQQQQQQQQQHESLLKQRSNSIDVLGSSLLQGPVFSTSIDTPSTNAIRNTSSSTLGAANGDGSIKWSSLHGMMMDPGNASSYDPQMHHHPQQQHQQQQHQHPSGNAEMVDMGAFLNGFPYNQDPTMLPHHQQSRPSATGSEILMHLERLHGSFNQGDDGSNNIASQVVSGGGGGGMEWNQGMSTSVMHSNNDPMFAPDNGLGLSMDVNDQ
ncbi:hypothetical protein HDU97_003020, partial [Phlyctochytrium planicorne]